MKDAYECLYLMIAITILLSVGIHFYPYGVDLHPSTVYGQTLSPPVFTSILSDQDTILTENLIETFQLVRSSSEMFRVTGQSEQPSTLKQNTTYFDPINKFTIQYPKDWTPWLDSLADYRDRVAFYSPLQDLNDPFSSQITVSMSIYNQNISLSDYTKQYISNLNNTSDIRIVDTNRYVLGGYPANTLVYSSFTPYIGNGTRFDNMATWTVVDGNKVFLLTYIAEATKYRIFLPVAIETINSFKAF